MRQVFVRTLMNLAKKDPRIVLATGDLGFKIFDDYRAQCHGQFFNLGSAEASLIGMSAGMALEGKIPFAYSIVPFLTMRPFEQIRNDVCFHKANVKLVGVGGGFSYGPNGPSHHGLSDVALMRLLPEMTVLTPGDPHEALWAVETAYQHKGPVYIRLGRTGEELVHKEPISLSYGKSIVVKEGEDIAILVSGLLLRNAVIAADILQKQGLIARVISFPSVKPLDEEMLKDTFDNFRCIFAIEEHSVCGGFGSTIAEFGLAKKWVVQKLHIIAAPDATIHTVGSHEYLRSLVGLAAEQIAQKILTIIKEPCLQIVK